MNGIFEYLPKFVKVLLFADDLTLNQKGKNKETIKRHLKHAIDTLEEWSNHTGLKFSTSKTKAINLTNKHIAPKQNL